MKNHGWENLCKMLQNGTKKGDQKTLKIPKVLKINTPKTMEKKQCKNMRKHATTGVLPRARTKSDPAQGEKRG